MSRPNSLLRPKSHWISQVWDGRYRLVDGTHLPKFFGPKSNLRVVLRSDLGHERQLNFRTLYYASAKPFTHPLQRTELLGRRFGSLVIVNVPQEWMSAHGKESVVGVRCDCGIETEKLLPYLLVGDTSSCGQCNWKTKEEWFGQKYHKLSVIPESESSHNAGLNLPEKFGAHVMKGIKLEVRCDCGKTNITRADGLFSFNTLSCGCALNENFSRAADDLGDFLSSLGVSFVKADKTVIFPRELDFWFPGRNLAVEYHGNHWHSEARRAPADKLKDYEKYQICREKGIDLVQIYSDEWREKRSLMEDLLRKRLRVLGDLRRVYRLRVRPITLGLANGFLHTHHYLGEVRGVSVVLGLFKKSELAGVATLRKHADHFECTRFAMGIGTRSFEPFRKVLDWMRDHHPAGTLITSFSDNRLHSGVSYRKLGFERAGDVRPDYCYTNGKHRRHKFQLRVPAGVSEVAKAAEAHYYRLWDSGKTKWVIRL